jgi:dolichol-phosphate mannosyltransferase
MQAVSEPGLDVGDTRPAVYNIPAGRLLVTIATYNEADNITPLINAIHEVAGHADILVIDDNSPDGTGRLADELAAKDRRVCVLHRPGKLGLGTATLAAMRHAMDHNYDFMLNLDADFSHPPRYIPALLSGMSDRDVMIGSRYVPGGGTMDWPLSRRLISRTVNRFVRLILRLPVRDASGAFRCYRLSLLRNAQLEKVRSRGYSFQQEVLFRCHRAGARIGEHPIVFENRKAGASKVNLKESVRSLTMLTWLGLRAAVGRD